jgi:hypothetical protein
METKAVFVSVSRSELNAIKSFCMSAGLGFSCSICKDGSYKVREEVYAAFRAGDIRILRIEREARRRIAEEARLAQKQAEEALILAKMAEIKTETAIKQRMEELATLF